MQTVTLKAKRFGKAVRYGCVVMMLICGMSWAGLALAAGNVSCSTTGTPTLVLGNVDALSAPPSAVTGSFTYTCTITHFTRKAYG